MSDDHSDSSHDTADSHDIIGSRGITGADSETQAKLRGQHDPGDAWVIAADGNKYWGKFGAAGLLAVDPNKGVLMQHRVEWSDHGGTWGVPGGAINQGETAIVGAIREAQEEAGVPDDAVAPLFAHVIDRGNWTYTTVIAHVTVPFTPTISDPESVALDWVPFDQMEELLLHPGFAKSWPTLKSIIEAEARGEAQTMLDELTSQGIVVTRI